MKVVSLFSGIGGFETGLLNSKVENFEFVFASEIDKHAAKSYEILYNHVPHGDITKIDESSIPDHELLIAGFPCQAFSIAGNQKGFSDTRGTLFFDVARILKKKKPKYIILENVKNLISHDNGKTINRIIEVLSEIGYSIDIHVLNAKHFGLPQNRERLIILGVLENKFEKFKLDSIDNKRLLNLKKALNDNDRIKKMNCVPNVIRKPCILSNYLDLDLEDKYYEFDVTIPNNCVVDKTSSNGIEKIFDIPRVELKDNERQRRVYSIFGISPTILARSDSPKVLVGNKVRKLTEKECLLIQGFPQEFYEKLKIANVSKTQIYKQAGNAVPPNIIEACAKSLLQTNFKFIDLFSGIGGFHLAASELGGKCVFASEIDEFAKKTYLKNYGLCPTGDLTKVDAKTIPNHDVLFAGFPCQPFSIAGHRRGFDDTRGTLFFDVARIIKEKKPKYFLLENVQGIVNHDSGNTISIIKKTLKDMGYFLQEFILNAKDYGVPQNRNRWYLVGSIVKINDLNFEKYKNTSYKLIDYIDLDYDQNITEIAKNNINKHLKTKNIVVDNDIMIANNIRPSKCNFSKHNYVPCLTAKMGTGGNNIPVIVNFYRKLSIHECLRLMSFPDDFLLPNSHQSYKQIGNSVVKDVVKMIIQEMLRGENDYTRP